VTAAHGRFVTAEMLTTDPWLAGPYPDATIRLGGRMT